MHGFNLLDYTFGGQADSFYEYLLKYWLYTGKRDKLHHEMYKKAIEGMKRHLLQRRNGHMFVANRRGNGIIEEQEHLTCFVPGMLALGAHEENDKETLHLAEQLAESCYLMYHKQRLGLSPEAVNINNFKPVLHRTYWSQRPETLESLFVLWRVTKNPKYRRWGYEIAQNIERHARVETGGYSGIENILANPIKYNDRQESYFLAETLKYLYLLFSSDDLLPLDKWVFNTEAHPFPINWRGISYSTAEQAGSKAPLKETLGHHDVVQKLGQEEDVVVVGRGQPASKSADALWTGKSEDPQGRIGEPRDKELEAPEIPTRDAGESEAPLALQDKQIPE